MNPSPPALVFAIAAAAGVLCLVVARHLRVPGIVVLLAAGVLLGPDVAGLVDPTALGRALPVIVDFAVAILLFEGALNLELRRLRRDAPALRLLLPAAAPVTAAPPMQASPTPSSPMLIRTGISATR